MSDIVSALWDPISSGYDDLKSAMKLGLTDILGSITYAFRLTFTYDEEKLNALIEQRRTVLDNIASEYQKQWQDFTQTMGPEFSAMTFFVAPGPYLAAYLSSNSRADLGSAVSALKNAGVPTRTITDLFDLSGIDPLPRDSDDETPGGRGGVSSTSSGAPTRSGIASLLTRTTDGMQKSQLEELLISINRKLAEIYGLRSGGRELSEGQDLIRNMLKNNKNTNTINESVEQSLKSAFSKLPDDSFNINSAKLLDARLELWRELQMIKTAPNKFIEMISKAETIEEITKSYEFLKRNSPVKIEGLEGNPMDRVNKVVGANYNKIKNDKESLKKLIDATGTKVKEMNGNEEEIKEVDAKKAILKVQIIKELENAKKAMKSSEFTQTIKKIEEQANKEFMKGIDVKSLMKLKLDDIQDNESKEKLSRVIQIVKKISEKQ